MSFSNRAKRLQFGTGNRRQRFVSLLMVNLMMVGLLTSFGASFFGNLTAAQAANWRGSLGGSSDVVFNTADTVVRVRPSDGRIFELGENKSGGVGGAVISDSSNFGGYTLVSSYNSDPVLMGENIRGTFDDQNTLHFFYQQRINSSSSNRVYYRTLDTNGVLSGPRDLALELYTSTLYGSPNPYYGPGSFGSLNFGNGPDIQEPDASFFLGAGSDKHLYLSIQENSTSGRWAGLWESSDHGATWGNYRILSRINNDNSTRPYPRVAAGPNGIVHTSLMGGTDSVRNVYASTRIGGNWIGPVNLTNAATDGPTGQIPTAIATDYNGNGYAIWAWNTSSTPAVEKPGFAKFTVSGSSGSWGGRVDNFLGIYDAYKRMKGLSAVATANGSVWVAMQVQRCNGGDCSVSSGSAGDYYGASFSGGASWAEQGFTQFGDTTAGGGVSLTYVSRGAGGEVHLTSKVAGTQQHQFTEGGGLDAPPATQLVFTTQPGNGVAGQRISPQPVVEARTATGVRATSFNGPVTLALNSGPGTLGGSIVTVNAVAGVATFDSIAVSQSGSYQLTASSTGLTSATSNSFTVDVRPAATQTYFHQITPIRIYDSRPGGDPSIPGGEGALAPGSSRNFSVGGVRGIPTNVLGVVGNLTVANTTAPGYLSLYPGGSAFPGVSTINWNSAGVALANFAIVKTGDVGGTQKVTAFNSGDPGAGGVQFLFDAVGYLDNNPTGGSFFHTVSPFRAFDSRSTGTPVLPGDSATGRDITINTGGVPARAKAAIVNLTAVEAQGPGGYVSVYAQGTAPAPLATRVSSVNWNVTNDVVANFAIVPLNTTNNTFTAYAYVTGTKFLVDVVGYIDDTSTGGTNPYLSVPGRAYDSRGDAAGKIQPGSPSGGNTNTRVNTIGGYFNEIPAGAKAAIVNLTVANTNGFGYLSLYPGNATVPPIASQVSSINYQQPNIAAANLAIVPLDTSTGQLRVFAGSNATNYIIDVIGYLN